MNLAIRWWHGLILVVCWTITVFALTWSTWPPIYLSRDDVNAGVPVVRSDLVVADANSANRVSRGAALRFALKLWVIPMGVVGVWYGLMVAHRSLTADT